jgi:hypothetical protein
MVSPSEVAMIETWAAARYPQLRGGSGHLVVRPRGADVVILERWSERRLEQSRHILKLRWVPKTGLWTLHWALGGGRWMERRPDDAPLEHLLDSIELDRLPA